MNNMKYFGVIGLLVACNMDDDKESVPGNDTAPTDEICFQQDGVDNGQIEIIEDAVTINTDTWAITPGAAPAAPATALPAGFETADYYGAVDPAAAAGATWWDGWTVGGVYDGSHNTTPFHPLEDDLADDTIEDGAANACATLGDGTTFVAGPDVTFTTLDGTTNYTMPQCIVSGDISADASLPNNHVFFFTENVTVGDGDAQLGGTTTPAAVTLTIAAGTQLYFAPGATALVISRGSQINAVGTADLPIIFGGADGDAANGIDGTAANISDLTERGRWGGLILSGFGETNSGDDNGELQTEASPEDQPRYYGGTNNADNSGTVQYVVIAESGNEIRPDEEIQGLTIEAAGSGTTIDHVQVLGSEDDCIEWFGGEASVSYALNNGCDDDGYDQDLGWTGTLQFGLHVQGAENGDRAIESDNNGDNFDAAPQTAPNIANITLLGDIGSDNESSAALHREGWRGKVYRSVYSDIGGAAVWSRGCLDVDDLLSADLEYFDVLANCSNGALLECDDAE